MSVFFTAVESTNYFRNVPSVFIDFFALFGACSLETRNITKQWCLAPINFQFKRVMSFEPEEHLTASLKNLFSWWVPAFNAIVANMASVLMNHWVYFH